MRISEWISDVCSSDLRLRPRQQGVQLIAALKIAQAGRVRRGDIDDGEIAQRRQPLVADGIIARPVGAVLVGAEIDANQPDAVAAAALGRLATCLQPPCRRLQALIVEAHAVADRKSTRLTSST